MTETHIDRMKKLHSHAFLIYSRFMAKKPESRLSVLLWATGGLFLLTLAMTVACSLIFVLASLSTFVYLSILCVCLVSGLWLACCTVLLWVLTSWMAVITALAHGGHYVVLKIISFSTTIVNMINQYTPAQIIYNMNYEIKQKALESGTPAKAVQKRLIEKDLNDSPAFAVTRAVESPIQIEDRCSGTHESLEAVVPMASELEDVASSNEKGPDATTTQTSSGEQPEVSSTLQTEDLDGTATQASNTEQAEVSSTLLTEALDVADIANGDEHLPTPPATEARALDVADIANGDEHLPTPPATEARALDVADVANRAEHLPTPPATEARALDVVNVADGDEHLPTPPATEARALDVADIANGEEHLPTPPAVEARALDVADVAHGDEHLPTPPAMGAQESAKAASPAAKTNGTVAKSLEPATSATSSEASVATYDYHGNDAKSLEMESSSSEKSSSKSRTKKKSGKKAFVEPLKK